MIAPKTIGFGLGSVTAGIAGPLAYQRFDDVPSHGRTRRGAADESAFIAYVPVGMGIITGIGSTGVQGRAGQLMLAAGLGLTIGGFAGAFGGMVIGMSGIPREGS